MRLTGSWSSAMARQGLRSERSRCPTSSLTSWRSTFGAREKDQRLRASGSRRGPVRANNFRRRVYRPALKAAGLDSGLTFHRLQHSAGHHMRETGEPLEVIQKRLGHASIRTTADVYGSLPVAVDKAASDRLNAMYESAADISRTWTRSRPPHRVTQNRLTRENAGGGERTRTADFYVANVALYQLSYTPVWRFQNSAHC